MSDRKTPVVLHLDQLSVGTLHAHEGARDGEVDTGEGQASAGQWLYRDVNLSAHQGEIVLILGASGSGKSLLMNLLIGKVRAHAERLYIPQGQVTLCGEQLIGVPYPESLIGDIGVLFQGLGLLEDLTARQNLQFAYDHATHPPQRVGDRDLLDEIAEELGLLKHLTRPVSELSGGQRQRVGVARLLAFGAKVMVFDEPTSALDPLASARVVELIAEAHERAESALTLIITHDYERFFSIADQVWQIQPDRTIKASYPSAEGRFEPTEYRSALRAPERVAPIHLGEAERVTHIARQRDLALRESLTRLPERVSKGLRLMGKPKRLYWGLTYGLNLFKEVVLKGLVFHISAGFLIGLIATYFAFNSKMGTVILNQLPELSVGPGDAGQDTIKVSQFILPTFFKEMLAGFSVVMYRALIPLFTCVFIAARGGTAATAYLSAMRDPSRSEWDALRSFGVNPHLFFLTQLTLTFSLGCMILSSLSFLSASLGSLVTSLWTNELCDVKLWWGAYAKGLGVSAQQWLPDGTLPMLLKAGMSGLCIALISHGYGARNRTRAQEVMTNLTKSNVWSVLLTLLVFFVVLVWENA